MHYIFYMEFCMARVTIEDCLNLGYNKYSLVNLVTKRIVQFRKGEEPLVSDSNEEVVLALREIAAKKITPAKKDSNIQGQDLLIENDNPIEEGIEKTNEEEGTFDKNL